MSRPSPARRTRRLVISPGALVLVVAAIALAQLTRTVFVAGRQPIGWVLASVVAAAAIEPAVSLLSRRMKRGFALVLVLVPLLAGAGLVARAVYADLDHSVEQLKEAIPEAAARIEDDARFGDVAKDMELRSRAERAVENLDKPSSRATDNALDRGSTYLVCTILTIFMLIWGPRFADAGLEQITDEERRRETAELVGTAFRRGQAYLDVSLLQAIVLGFASWGTFTLLDVPAPTPLALVVAVSSLVPVIGLLLGSVPGLLMIAGFNSTGQALIVLVAVIGLQIAQILGLRALSRRSLYVGPAVIVIAALLGLDMYGLGGAVFLTAVAVFGVALIDTRAENAGFALSPRDADPTVIHPVPATDAD